MPRGRQVPTTDAFVVDLAKRLGKLERQLQAVTDSRRTPLLFSFAGTVPVGVPSPPLRPIHPTQINLVVPQVTFPPSGGDLTIDLYLNLVNIRTLTVPDGQTYSEDAVPFVIPAGGSLVAIVTAANGAGDLSISLIPELL